MTREAPARRSVDPATLRRLDFIPAGLRVAPAVDNTHEGQPRVPEFQRPTEPAEVTGGEAPELTDVELYPTTETISQVESMLVQDVRTALVDRGMEAVPGSDGEPVGLETASKELMQRALVIQLAQENDAWTEAKPEGW